MAKDVRILIVDDDVEFAESLKDILDAEGYGPQIVNGANEAIDEVERDFFDIILMDIKMPTMNGVDAFKKIKAISPKTVVIMMTAFSVEDLIKNAIEEGTFGILYKPLDIKKLMEIIARVETGGGLIMIADDDPNICETLKDVFTEKGYSISLAKNSDEAIKIVKEKSTNIVFLDMKFFPLNGLETYLMIRRVNSKVVVILMTAYRQETKDLVKQALESSAYSCFYKPFDPQKAVDIVEEIIKKRR